jgi:hypothetical protein
MPPISIDDFAQYHATCEIRHKQAFLIFDRTGHVVHSLRKSFSDLLVSTSTPQQTVFSCDQGTISVEIGAQRFTTERPDARLETFSKHCREFFRLVVSDFEIEVFTRVGLRCMFRKEFKTEEDSKAALASINLANLKPTKRFNSSDSPVEIYFRWEDSQTGASVRLKAETIDIKSVVPPSVELYVPKVDKKVIALVADVDYYTVAPVIREQWEPEHWIQDKVKLIKRELDGIMKGGSQ